MKNKFCPELIELQTKVYFKLLNITMKILYNYYNLKKNILICFLCLIFVTHTSDILADSQKVTQDVYGVLQEIKAEVKLLRKQYEIRTAWPKISTYSKHYPRHMLQKCFEIFEKIKLLRNIKQMGEITTPYYPSRKIIPDEVYDVAVRLLGELRIVIENVNLKNKSLDISPKVVSEYEANYILLSEISRALDPVLGLDGFTSNDVYTQTKRVIENVRFLRSSQNLPEIDEAPDLDMTFLRHPNHVLKEVYKLLEKISQIETALKVDPCEVPKLQFRQIEPNEVYDAMHNVLTELQRIKYHLGFEFHTSDLESETGKTYNDAIYNLKLTQNLLPLFDGKIPLLKEDPNNLKKSSTDIFKVTVRIAQKLTLDGKAHGITIKLEKELPPGTFELEHIYHKTNECLQKSNKLRVKAGLVETAINEYPLRGIDSCGIFALVSRFEKDLDIIHKAQHGKVYEIEEELSDSFSKKNTTEVYWQMWQNSYILDSLISL